METVIESIISKDIKDLKHKLSNINPDEHWEQCPLLLILENYTNVSDKIKARYIIQTLINWGYDKKCAVEYCCHSDFIENSVGYVIKECILNTTKQVSLPPFNNFNSGNTQKHSVQPVTSNYSKHELSRLQTIAKEIGIHYTTNTHLALKIIEHLRKK